MKANIGHLEGTAGVAGLIKSILVLERGIIPPVANLEVVNREIDAQHLNLKVRAAKENFSCRLTYFSPSFLKKPLSGQQEDCAEFL